MDRSGCATNGCGLPRTVDENTAEAVDGAWPRRNPKKRLWVAHPCGFVFCKGGVFLLLFSNFQFLISIWAKKDGAYRSRDHQARGGGRRVRRRSSDPRGRGGGENRRRAFLLSASCIRCNSIPGCGRNCSPTSPAAQRAPGTGPWAWFACNSRNISLPPPP